MSLKNKTVVITGASSGIGRACAEEFASKGANLVLAARQHGVLMELAQDLEKRFAIRALAVPCDISQEEACRSLIHQVIATFEKIDVLVNNAGISMRALFQDVDLIVLKNVMDVNFWGAVYCTKYALPALVKSKGSVVGVSSGAGYHGLPGRTGYSASKFALNGFLEALRIEHLKTGLHVCLVAPGFTASNIRRVALVADGTVQGESSMDEKAMMTSEEVARLLVDGVIRRKRTILMTFQVRFMVFLNKIFPYCLDQLIYRHFTKEKNPLIK